MESGPDPTSSHDPRQGPFVQPEVVAGRREPMGQPPQPIIIQQSGGNRLARFVSWLGWIGLIFCVPIMLGMLATFREYFDTSGGIQEKYHSLSKSGRDKVAVLRVEGVMLESNGFVKRQIDRIRADRKVKAVVIRVDSPGGTVSAADYLLHHLNKLRKDRDFPIVVSMGGTAASGGYYISMAVGDQENSIFAEPTTTTGSIGVILRHFDISGLLERFDVKDESITSHPRKQLLAMTKEISPEDREILQRYVDESFERFKKIIRRGRPAFRENPQALDVLATGEIFSAEQAKQSGLVDEIGFIEDAISRAIELANLSASSVRVVTYRRIPTLRDAIGFVVSNNSPPSSTLESIVFNLSTPRAYYLSSSLQGFVPVPADFR